MLWFYCENFSQTSLEQKPLYDYAAANFCIFHDVIYDPKATGGDNEINSLDLFQNYIQDLDFNKNKEFEETHEFITEAIRDTITHSQHS